MTIATAAARSAPGESTIDWFTLFRALLLVWAAFILIARRAAVRGTTMTAPLVWSIVALAALVAYELALLVSTAPAWREEARYLAATLTLAAPIAVLGAKRPQDRAWQWIVLSLLVVLWLPLAHQVVLRRSSHFNPPSAWQLLSLAIIAIGWLNYAATRWTAAATLCAAGQTLLLAESLPLIGRMAADAAWDDAGTALIALAALAVAYGWGRKTQPATGYDAAWLAFRDMYGAAWSVRVAERFNAAGRTLRWPVALTWNGFRSADNGVSTPANLELTAAMQNNIRGALRRFVSKDWIASH